MASVIGDTTMNWDNPLVQKSIDNMLKVTPKDIEDHMDEQSKKYIEFVAENYRKIF